MFSIGGAAFASNWDQALNQNAAKLATNAAAIANAFGVGMEIDYEQDSGASMNLLTTFVKVMQWRVGRREGEGVVSEGG